MLRCYMDTITHREMRNRSAEVLRRVEAGESLEVSNHGRPVAIIMPVGTDVIEAANARSSRAALESLRAIQRTKAAKSTAAMIEDARGRW